MRTRKELEQMAGGPIPWTADGRCPRCDCCPQVLCVEASLGQTVTCAYVADGYSSRTRDAGRAVLHCPCTPVRLRLLQIDYKLQRDLEAGRL